MIEHLLPPGVAGAHLRDFSAAGPLPAAEETSLGPVGPARAGEFAAGRHCARAALSALGRPGAELPRRGDRAPGWPAGTVGSITHCRGYCAAAAGPTVSYLSIGIDAEPNEPLPAVVLPRISSAAERRWIGAAPGGVHWDRLLFSAKESVYKTWAPLTGAWLGFLDATVTVEPAEITEVAGAHVTGRFRVALHVPPPRMNGVPPRGFDGRFLALPDLLLTAIVLPRPGAPGVREGMS